MGVVFFGGMWLDKNWRRRPSLSLGWCGSWQCYSLELPLCFLVMVQRRRAGFPAQLMEQVVRQPGFCSCNSSFCLVITVHRFDINKRSNNPQGSHNRTQLSICYGCCVMLHRITVDISQKDNALLNVSEVHAEILKLNHPVCSCALIDSIATCSVHLYK